MSQSKFWCFTLNNYEGLLQFNEDNMDYLVYQEEVGENGTPHLQGYVEFKRRIRMGQAKEYLGEDTIHLERRMGTAAQAIAYCKKAGRVGGPYEWGVVAIGARRQGQRGELHEFREAVLGGMAREEAVDQWPSIFARYRLFADETFEQYRVSQLPARPVFIPRPGWQSTIAEIIAGEPSKRKVHWISDTAGNSGKSHFAGCCENAYVITGGRWADIYYAYQFQSVVIFDWSRDAETFPYGVLESFKNGYFLSTKYRVCTVRFAVPHVVVLANFQPDRSKLSQDRWDVHNVLHF